MEALLNIESVLQLNSMHDWDFDSSSIGTPGQVQRASLMHAQGTGNDPTAQSLRTLRVWELRFPHDSSGRTALNFSSSQWTDLHSTTFPCRWAALMVVQSSVPMVALDAVKAAHVVFFEVMVVALTVLLVRVSAISIDSPISMDSPTWMDFPTWMDCATLMPPWTMTAPDSASSASKGEVTLRVKHDKSICSSIYFILF